MLLILYSCKPKWVYKFLRLDCLPVFCIHVLALVYTCGEVQGAWYRPRNWTSYRTRRRSRKCRALTLRAEGRTWPTAPVHWDHVRTTHPPNTTLTLTCSQSLVFAGCRDARIVGRTTTAALDALSQPPSSTEFVWTDRRTDFLEMSETPPPARQCTTSPRAYMPSQIQTKLVEY